MSVDWAKSAREDGLDRSETMLGDIIKKADRLPDILDGPNRASAVRRAYALLNNIRRDLDRYRATLSE